MLLRFFDFQAITLLMYNLGPSKTRFRVNAVKTGNSYVDELSQEWTFGDVQLHGRTVKMFIYFR